MLVVLMTQSPPETPLTGFFFASFPHINRILPCIVRITLSHMLFFDHMFLCGEGCGDVGKVVEHAEDCEAVNCH
jgi:hypothetical protein